jgi:hypothetical protein
VVNESRLDALVTCEIEQIPNRELPNSARGERFGRLNRPPPEVFGSEKEKAEVSEAIAAACSKIRFQFCSGDIDP